jgi:ribosome-binding protein aMBF1 (putative translation factor)
MIRNQRQYKITKAQVAKFEQVLQTFDERPPKSASVHPRLVQAQREAMASQLESLQAELKEYERLQRKKPSSLKLELVAELPETLIRARISAGLSQRELAERLGLKEQQIQRYEATNYETASLRRVMEVARALTSEAA